MSETKHTPGPWEYSRYKPGKGPFAISVGLNSGYGKMIAAVGHCPEISEQEEECNAKLIAAAPELLTRLQKLLTLLGKTGAGANIGHDLFSYYVGCTEYIDGLFGDDKEHKVFP